MATIENDALFTAISEEDSATVSGGVTLEDLNKSVTTAVTLGNGQAIFVASINAREIGEQLAQKENITLAQLLQRLEADFKRNPQ